MHLEKKLDSIEVGIKQQNTLVEKLYSELKEVRSHLEEVRTVNLSSSFSIVTDFTSWKEGYAKKQVKAGLVPCRDLGGGVYEFSMTELRLWNRWGRPAANEFYERLERN